MTAGPRRRAACSSRSCYKSHSGAFSCPRFAIQLSCERGALAQHQQPQKLIGAVLRTKVYTGQSDFRPANGFGEFGPDVLLVGNFGDGKINAFNIHSEASVGSLLHRKNQPPEFSGLWSLFFLHHLFHCRAG
jgi:hypothetical protein